MMKTRLPILVILSLLFVSCTNLDDIYNRLDDHEARLKKLETMTAEANNTIMSLQKLVDAQAKKISIVSYSVLPNGEGYKLVMSDGSEIILKHGIDGQTPDIGVKMVGGVLYWTLNGELMRDAYGNPIPAKGEKGEDGQDGNDGQNGVTPQLRINAAGQWEVSLDNGNSWQLVLDANGNPVQAEGKDANESLKITDNGDGTITIVFNGQTFIIPKSAGAGPQPTEPKLAIEYMADFNVNQAGDAFVSEQINNVSGFFNFDEAVAKFSSVTIGGTNYHLPSASELLGIFPATIYWNMSIDRGIEEEITVGDVTKTYKADYYSPKANIAYGLKFINADNDQRTAYRYELVAMLNGSEDYFLLKVTARHIGADASITRIEHISSETWWNTNNEADITKILPSSGVKDSNGDFIYSSDGSYWSSTPSLLSGWAYCLNFEPGALLLEHNFNTTDLRSVRLFRSK